jgi:hypothetical protein
LALGAIITSASTTDRLLQVPIEIRPHVGASLAASCADKPRLDIRNPTRRSGPQHSLFGFLSKSGKLVRSRANRVEVEALTQVSVSIDDLDYFARRI